VRHSTAWVVTRAPLVAIVLGWIPYAWPSVIRGDLNLYAGWAAVLGDGRFPADDLNWQYPPAAALPILAPEWLPGSYLVGFLTLAVLADLGILLLLRGRRDGVWVWIAGVPLLGPVAYARYDIVVALVAVAALALAARPVLQGVLIGLGAMLKVWPLLLLIGARRPGAAAGGAAASAAGIAVVLALFLPGSTDFLSPQRGRGIQIESVPGTVFLLGRHLGWDGTSELRFGAREWVGSGVDTVRLVAPVLTVVALGWLLWTRRRATWQPADAALTAVLLAVVTSRVLSPQYLIWLVALAAVCLTGKDTVQRPTALLVLLATGLTQLEFPVLWSPLVAGSLADLVLVARNVVLVVATVTAVRALTRAPDRVRVE
jgi:Glycosyltransferase family 87